MTQRITDTNLEIWVHAAEIYTRIPMAVAHDLALDLRDCRASLAERDAEIRRLKEQLTESGVK